MFAERLRQEKQSQHLRLLPCVAMTVINFVWLLKERLILIVGCGLPSFGALMRHWGIAFRINSLMELKASLMELKASLMELKASLMEFKASLMELKASLMEFKASLMEFKASLMEFKASLMEFKASFAIIICRLALQR